jgi:uncharacterized membrane protein
MSFIFSLIVGLVVLSLLLYAVRLLPAEPPIVKPLISILIILAFVGYLLYFLPVGRPFGP